MSFGRELINYHCGQISFQDLNLKTVKLFKSLFLLILRLLICSVECFQLIQAKEFPAMWHFNTLFLRIFTLKTER